MDILAFTVKAVGFAAVLLLVFALWRIVNDEKNALEWYHLVSTKSADGTQAADWDKIGKGGGVFLCLLLPGLYAYSEKMDAIGLAALMTVALAYLGGVSAYGATLRARQGTTEKITEPADPPPGAVKTTETTTAGTPQ